MTVRLAVLAAFALEFAIVIHFYCIGTLMKTVRGLVLVGTLAIAMTWARYWVCYFLRLDHDSLDGRLAKAPYLSAQRWASSHPLLCKTRRSLFRNRRAGYPWKDGFFLARPIFLLPPFLDGWPGTGLYSVMCDFHCEGTLYIVEEFCGWFAQDMPH